MSVIIRVAVLATYAYAGFNRRGRSIPGPSRPLSNGAEIADMKNQPSASSDLLS